MIQSAAIVPAEQDLREDQLTLSCQRLNGCSQPRGAQ